MDSSILTALLLCIAAPGTRAPGPPNKNLGDVCPAGEPCLHASLLLACDGGRCRIQQGQVCSAEGHGPLCVAGAECASGTCTCKGPHYTAAPATGLCTAAALKWGWGPCTAAATTECPAASPNFLECTAPGPCKCTTNKYVDLSTGLCAEIATSKTIGFPCTADRIIQRRRKRAASTADCGVATEIECDSSFCKCAAGYTGSPGGTCAEIPASKFGKKCDAGTAAADCGTTTNLDCTGASNTLCVCKIGYTGVPGGGCSIAAGELNGPCSTILGCTSSEANDVCAGDTAFKTCVCKSGYSLDSAGTACELTPGTNGGSCTGGPALKGTCADANGICSAASAGTCSCKTGYTVGSDMTCKADLKIGGKCTGSSGQGDCEDANALCTSLICTCKPGYTGMEGGTCTKVTDNAVGGACTGTSRGSCTDPEGLCVNLVCGCPPAGFTPSIGAGCAKIAANTFGGGCTGTGSSGTCTDTNAVCTNLFCTCTAPFQGIKGHGCAAANADGGSCNAMVANTKGSCTNPNAKCSAQIGGTCVLPRSGAAATLASLTLLLAAIVGVMTLV